LVIYEIREKAGGIWGTITSFNTIKKARDFWSTSEFTGVEAALVKVESKETFEHYHSADGKEVY
jgi:hypothetical protein